MESIWILSGVHQESIRSLPGVHTLYQESIRSPPGAHQDAWGSVTYRDSGTCISTKAFKPEDVILVDDQWKHIKKPTDKKCQSIIVWAKDNKFDTTPTETKIVSSRIYSGDFVCPN
jgi:hypothetical protein